MSDITPYARSYRAPVIPPADASRASRASLTPECVNNEPFSTSAFSSRDVDASKPRVDAMRSWERRRPAEHRPDVSSSLRRFTFHRLRRRSGLATPRRGGPPPHTLTLGGANGRSVPPLLDLEATGKMCGRRRGAAPSDRDQLVVALREKRRGLRTRRARPRRGAPTPPSLLVLAREAPSTHSQGGAICRSCSRSHGRAGGEASRRNRNTSAISRTY